MYLHEAFDALLVWRDEINKRPAEDVFAFFAFCLKHLTHSKAQRFQDLLVLFELKEKKRGFFVEFGAYDGHTTSNTYLLEKHYEWNGILAEPLHSCLESIKQNRNCALDFRCVWKSSGEQVEFNATNDGLLSTIDRFSNCDKHAEVRKSGKKYQVETVSLNDLLKQHAAPQSIDYISVDTEGSELDILEVFDFDFYDVKIFSIEHNFTNAREKIHALMTAKGYVRKFEPFSSFDDWYVKQS